MGDIADYYTDRALEEEFEFQDRINKPKSKLTTELTNLETKYNLRELYWKTADGKSILIQNLELNHLKNIIDFLERKEYNPIRNKTILILRLELAKRLDK